MPTLSLAQNLTSRTGTGSVDSKIVNGFIEKVGERTMAVKRPGTFFYRFLAPTGSTGQGILLHAGLAYFIFGDILYNSQPVGVVHQFPIPSPGSGQLQYDLIGDQVFGSGTIALIKSANGLWIFDGTTVAKVTDVNYPAATVRGLAVLDGAYYVMDTKGNIQGSNLQDPTTWGALNTIAADASIGIPRALRRHMNYLLSFGDVGTQGFYDNANPSPGSPLSAAGNVSFLVGCAESDSLTSLNDLTVFVSRTKQAGISVTILSGLQMVAISSPFVDRMLSDGSISVITAFGLTISGHSFYVLTSYNIHKTFVVDLQTHEWFLWTSTDSFGVETEFRYSNASAFDGSTNTYSAPGQYLQGVSDGASYTMSDTVYQDNGNPINFFIRTLPVDGGTNATKFFSGLRLIGDTVQSTINIRYSDDDYQTFSNYQPIDLSSSRKQLRPMGGLGKARHRSFDLQHTANTPVRLSQIEFDIKEGTT